LGFYQQQYTPTKRGFDKFFGFLGPFINYFDYKLKEENYTEGFDMRRNDEIADDFGPIYATDLFTREAVKAIEAHDIEKPMFLLINHLAPHAGSESSGKSDNQAPPDEIEKFAKIENEKRRKLAGDSEAKVE
jgi:arylsulfatase B